MMVGLRSWIRAQQASTLARSRSIGFSHSTALPASTARTSRSRWVSVDEAISTASTSPAPRISSIAAARRAPVASAVAAAACVHDVVHVREVRSRMAREIERVHATDATTAENRELDHLSHSEATACAGGRVDDRRMPERARARCQASIRPE